MKILHINCSDSGSTGKIISDISRYVYSKGGASVLCAPKITDNNNEQILKKYAVCLRHEQGVYGRFSYISGIPYGFAPISTHKILNVIKLEKPDIVHLHSINVNMVNVYKLLNFLKKQNIRTIVTNHAEFLYTGNCAHSEECENWKKGCGNCPMLKKATGSNFFDKTKASFKKMEKAFKGFKDLSIVSVSPWSKDRAKLSPIMDNYKHYIIENGINTDVFNTEDYSCFDSKKSEKIILYVTSYFTNSPLSVKGGEYFIELARRFQKDNIKFVVAAGTSNINIALPDNILLLGNIRNQSELATWYKKADLTVLTSKRETFGMAVAESLCCGTPVVGFKCGGSESIAIKDFTEFVEFGDIDALEIAIRSEWLKFKENNNINEISLIASKKYDSDIMAEKYYKLYTESE